MSSCRHGAHRALFGLVLAGMIVASFFLLSRPSLAQTYTYTGPAFDLSECATYFGGTANCVNGSASATATVTVGSSYTGSATGAQLPAYNLTLNGVGASEDLTGCPTITPEISFYNGQVTQWQFGAFDSCSSAHSYAEQGSGEFAVDDGFTQNPATGAYIQNGFILGSGFWNNGKVLGKPCPNKGTPHCGDPIDIGSGNVFEQVTDYETAGQNKLSFIRYYNSMSGTDTFATTIGRNWRSNYDRYLHLVSASQVEAERPDGQIVNFALVGSTWTPDTDIDMTLTNSGSTWTLKDHDDTIETYTASGSKAVLNTIALPNSYTQTLNYTSGVLTSVSDSYSRTLSFTYTSGLLTGVTTPDSLVLSYGHTASGTQYLLTSVGYNTSPATSQTYVYGNVSFPFMLTGITDENSNAYASWSYDGFGRATLSEHAGGADEMQVSYDDTTGNRTVTGPLGIQDTYQFTYLQGVPKVIEIDRAANGTIAAASRYFTYDTNGYLATATDWNGNTTSYTNDAHGDPTTIVEASGSGVARTTTVLYDTTWVHKPYTTTKTGVTIDDRYDATKGNLLTHKLTDTTTTSIPYSTNGQTRTWTYTYTATGQLHTVTTPRTDLTLTTTYAYTGGTLTSITDPLSHVTTINTYTGGGLPTKITDANSVETDLAYNQRNWLTSKTVVKTGGNEVTTYTYTGSGQPHVVTLPDSSSDTLTYAYDNAQRLKTITNGASETTNYTLDAMGDVTLKTIKNASAVTVATHSATFDALGHMLTSVGATAPESTSFAWDGQGNRITVTDANSNATGTAWDALNRASTVTDALTHTATPTYDARDNVTNQTDFNGYSTAFVFDGFPDAAIQKASPDTGTAVYHYDLDGNQTQRTDARSVVTNRTFDKLERPLTESFPAYTAENIAYTYDSTTSGNKGIGRLTSVTDESGSTTITYDTFGNIITEVRVIGGKTYTTSYSYDLANRLKEIIYPSGRYVDYTYDTHGYLTTVTTKPTSGGTVTTLASSIVHEPFGPIASFTYGNTLAQTRSYDANYWLTGIVTSNGTTHIQNLTFGYDNAGNLHTITDSLDTTRNQTFGVDALNRLHTATGKYGSRTYTYDSNTNRATWYNGTITRTTTNNTSKNTMASITDGTNTRHFTWTNSGNMASDDRVMDGGLAVAYTYGGRDRLESLTVSSQPVTFKINALGERVSKATVSATTHFMFDLAGHIIGEANGSTGANLREYVWMENIPLAQIDSSGNIVYIHPDQVNAPQKITNPSKTIVWDYEVEPFGETYATPTNTTPTNHRFPGQYSDTEDSLYYNLYRDYDPTLGRYVQADLLGLSAGTNLFSYVGQTPTQEIDPNGLLELVLSGGYHVPFSPGVSVGQTAAITLYSTNPANVLSGDGPTPDIEIGAIVDAGISLSVAKTPSAPATQIATNPNLCPDNEQATPTPFQGYINLGLGRYFGISIQPMKTIDTSYGAFNPARYINSVSVNFGPPATASPITLSGPLNLK
jgi:RHS repeat-associated protein